MGNNRERTKVHSQNDTAFTHPVLDMLAAIRSAFASTAASPLARFFPLSRGLSNIQAPAGQQEDQASVSKDQEVASPSGRHQRSISEIRAEIFGAPCKEHVKDGRAILARKLQGKEIASWYFLPPTETPGFHNEERE